MKEQCIKCDKVKGECKCERPEFEFFTERDDVKEVEKSVEIRGNDYLVKKEGEEYSIKILDHPVANLRPLTLLDNGVRMILVYLPTKVVKLKGVLDPQFKNSAFFAIYKPETKKKLLLPIDDSFLKENFAIDVLSEWPDNRWPYQDLQKWKKETKLVDPKELYQLHDQTLSTYLDFESAPDYTYFNLWNIGTYFYELFDAYPYNDFTGTKRAGKSKSLELQKHVCFNSLMTADISGSATFRVIQGIGATVLLDETEQFKNQKNEQAQQVRTLLMQGFLRDQHAVRSEGKAKGGFIPVLFNLFSPKSLAHINSFDEVLEERCIPQIMRRSKNKEMLRTWVDKKNPAFKKIRSFCYRLFLDYADEINGLQVEARKLLNVNGRELLIWTPIITLALFFEKYGVKGLVANIQKKATTSSADRQIMDEQQSYELRIVQFLDDVMVEFKPNETQDSSYSNPLGWITISDIYHRLSTPEYSTKYEINPEYFSRNKLTQTLRRLGLKSDKKVGGISWLVTRIEVNDVKERMGMKEATQTTLPLTSVTSKSSESSVLGVDATNKTEVNEVIEGDEVKVSHSITTLKTEGNEQTEVPENNQTSKSSESSVDDSGDYLITPKDDDED